VSSPRAAKAVRDELTTFFDLETEQAEIDYHPAMEIFKRLRHWRSLCSKKPTVGFL